MKNLEKLEGRVPDGALSNSSLPSISVGVFLLSDELHNSFNELETHVTARKARISTFKGGSAAAIETLEYSSFDLVFVEFDGNSEETINKVSHISAKCSPGTKAIVAGAVNDIELYRKLIDSGVSDYVTPPFTASKIQNAISKLYPNSRSEHSKSIAFLGVKGGVGSSILAQNTAYYAANSLGEKTIALDFDLSFGTCGINFDIASKSSFSDLIQKTEQIDELLVERTIERVSENLSILALYDSPSNNIDSLSEKYVNIIECSKKLSSLVVIDLKNTASAEATDVLRYVDEIVLVAEPNLANLRNAITWKRHLNDLRGDAGNLHLVLNKLSENPRNTLSEADFKRMSGMAACSLIPLEPDTFLKSEEINLPAVASSPNSKASKEIILFIQNLISKNPVHSKKSFLYKIVNIFKG